MSGAQFRYFDTTTHHIKARACHGHGALPPDSRRSRFDGELGWADHLDTPLHWLVQSDRAWIRPGVPGRSSERAPRFPARSLGIAMRQKEIRFSAARAPTPTISSACRRCVARWAFNWSSFADELKKKRRNRSSAAAGGPQGRSTFVHSDLTGRKHYEGQVGKD